ncbi:MAG: anti-sigma factor family protein [Candidatus Binatia bacterium]
MNCEEVAKHLTEYLDKNLDMAMTTRVATHVISCAHCRAESNELTDCIQQVATLPLMEPPLGFAQRVMAHARDSEPKASLWQRLIVPLTGGVAVQATAMAAIAIVAVVIYQNEPALKPNPDVNLALRSDSPPPIKENERVAPAAARQASELGQKTGDPLRAPADLAKRSIAETSPRASSSSPAESPQVQPASPAPSRADIENPAEEKKEVFRRPPLRVQEVTTARDSGFIFGDRRSFIGPPPAPIVLERPIALGDRVADFEFVVRRRSPQRRDTIENLSSTEAEDSPAAARRPSTMPPTGRARIESIAEIRFYDVAPEHFEIFKKELATEANIESEPKVSGKEIEAAKQADRQLLVKVTILPVDRATPTR